MNRQTLASLAGISPSTVAELEENQQVPGVAVVARLAAALKISPAALAFRLDSENAATDASTETLGERLTQARLAKGYSRKALARAAELSDTAIRHSEEGRHLPSLAAIEQLAKALRISPGWLAFGAEPAREGQTMSSPSSLEG